MLWLAAGIGAEARYAESAACTGLNCHTWQLRTQIACLTDLMVSLLLMRYPDSTAALHQCWTATAVNLCCDT